VPVVGYELCSPDGLFVFVSWLLPTRRSDRHSCTWIRVEHLRRPRRAKLSRYIARLPIAHCHLGPTISHSFLCEYDTVQLGSVWLLEEILNSLEKPFILTPYSSLFFLVHVFVHVLQNMIAHIRYATTGAVSLENVHPFSRELWGIQWTFAHNGQVPKFDDSTALEDQPLLGRKTTIDDLHYNPIGDTDSEAVFCAILNALKVEFKELPTLPVLHSFLSRLSHEIIQGEEDSTIFNFLLGCGQYTLFAYSWPGRRPGSQVWNGLYYLVREPPFSTAKLIDVDYSIDFAEVTTPSDRVAVITTKPLTSEQGWQEFERGQLLMFDKGLPYKTPGCCELAEREGRGLCSKFFDRKRGQSFSSSRSLSTSPPTSNNNILSSSCPPRSPKSTLRSPC
jgi:predicted glutamine amidotransferase